jgi:hypothetical protein
VRRRARKAECKADEWEIAETLAGSDWRLLTLHAPDGWEPAAEVAHEQLLRKWLTLTRWLEAQREFLIWKGEIEADRREWEKLPEAEGEPALLSGRRLLRAEQWLESHGEDLPEQDRTFIAKSAERDQQVRLKADLDEKRLKDAELQAALQRAEAAKDREAAAKKITRRTLVGTTGVAAVGGLASYFGYSAYEAAEQNRNARAALNNQLADLRNFWTQTGGRELPTIAGGPEETKAAPAIRVSNQGEPTWGVKALGVDKSPYTGKGCVVGLVGTGIEISHPAFREVTFIQKDFTGTGNGDEHGHTTHTAGTIFGRPVDNQRFGIAPGVTEVVSAKVLDAGGLAKMMQFWRGFSGFLVTRVGWT